MAPKNTPQEHVVALDNLKRSIVANNTGGISYSSAKADEIECIFAILDYERQRQVNRMDSWRCAMQEPGTMDLSCQDYPDAIGFPSEGVIYMLDACGADMS